MRCGRTTTTLASAGIPPKASSTSTTVPTCTTPRGRSRVTMPTTSTTLTGRASRASPLPRRHPSTRTTTREHDRGVPQIVAALRIATELNARESQDARVFPARGFRQMCSRAVPWLLAVACGRAPAVRPPPPTPAGSAAHTSPAGGPALDGSAAVPFAPHDHEITLRTATQQITLRDGEPAVAAPLDDPAHRVISFDGSWGVQIDYHASAIVAGTRVDGHLVAPVTIHGEGPLIRYVAGSGAHRTVLLDRSNWGWYLERSDDAGATWTEPRIFVAGSPIVTSRASYDVVTREGNWVHIGRDGTVATTPGVLVEPTSSACASAVLWVPVGEQRVWFARAARGNVSVGARGELACSGNAVLAAVEAGLVRCTPAGCDAPVERGDFADLASDGVVTAIQHGNDVQVRRTNHAAATLHLADGERVVAMAGWRDVPTLVVLGASGRLHLASSR